MVHRCTMMRKKAFVSIVSSYVGCCIASVLRRQGYDVVGSIRAEGSEMRSAYSLYVSSKHGDCLKEFDKTRVTKK